MFQHVQLYVITCHVIMGIPQFGIHHKTNEFLIMVQKICQIAYNYTCLLLIGDIPQLQLHHRPILCYEKYWSEYVLDFFWNKYFFSSFKLYSLMVNQSVQINCKTCRVRSELQQNMTGGRMVVKKFYLILMMVASLSQETSLHPQITP